MPISSRVSGTWYENDPIFAEVSGATEELSDGWVKVSGVWQPFYSSKIEFVREPDFYNPDGIVAVPLSLTGSKRYALGFLVATRGGNINLVSAVINGATPMTIIAQQSRATFGSNQVCVALVAAPYPSGATYTITPTWDNSPSGATYYAYSVIGLKSTTQLGKLEIDLGGGGTTTFGGNMNIQKGGMSIAAYYAYGHPDRVISIPTMTKDYSVNEGTNNTQIYNWSIADLVTTTPKTFTWTTTNPGESTDNFGVLVAATLR